jgi:TRAP-type uncharacterized transport system substrate-binding protein
MNRFWEETLSTAVKVASGYAGSYSMTRVIGRQLSEGPLRRRVVMVVPATGRLQHVADGSIDLGWSIPAIEAKWAMEGRGPGYTTPLPNLRAVARFPQNDRFMAAAAPWSGITRLAQIAEAKRPLRIAVRVNPGEGYGWFENKIFARYGFSLDDVVAWGGRHWSVGTHVSSIQREVEARAVDLVVGEASTQPIWAYLAANGFRFLSLDQQVVDALVREEGMEPNIVPAGFLPGISEPLLSIDESDFVLVVRDSAEDQLIYEIARIIDENRRRIEEGAVMVEYNYTKPLPIPELTLRSPLTGPISEFWRTPIPLHPAAERYYREKGYLK